MGFPRLGRRGLIVGGMAAAGLPRFARAAYDNGVVVGRDGWLFSAWDDARHSDPAMIEGVAATINAAVAMLKQAGIQSAVSVTPEKERVYREFLPPDYKPDLQADRRYEVVTGLLRKPGTAVPDQAGLFANLRRQQPDTPFFFKADTHWTAAGAEASARLMAQEIRAKVALPAAPGPGLQLAPPSDALQERNDLAAMLPSAQQAGYPFQHYPVRKPFASGGSGLLDGDAADVLVIGNSYMQPAYGYANVLSEQLNRPVTLYWKVHQQSLYFTMLSYLRGDGFRKVRPRLVVWNMTEDDFEVPSNNPGVWGQTAMAPSAFLAGMKQALGV